MNKIDKNILKEAEQFVSNYFKENKDHERFYFHTIKHTRYVVNAVIEIGKAEKLDEETIDLLAFCAWFHDIGYMIDCKSHEEESIKIAKEYLKDKNIEKSQIDSIECCIKSTRWPQMPSDELSKVLCDADMRHLADPEYFEFSDQLRMEMAAIKGEKMKKLHFQYLNVAFLNHHRYFTNYGKETLSEGKNNNILLLEKKLEKSLSKEAEKATLEISKENEKLKKKIEKSKGYSRGVESMFRLTARNQISLSSIADNKSNILITVNSIIISIILTVLINSFDDNPALILPTLVFLAFSVTTIIFSILSTRPNISKGRFTKEDIKENKVNLLFFGNFYNMEFDEYEWAIQELMKNDDHLYSTMTKDQYFLGKVLAKKYKLLRIAYNVFMIGIIVSVLAFVLAFTNI